MGTNLNQGYLFLVFILIGFIIGILFDVFRVLRKTFKTSDLVTYIQDILFWLLSGIILIYSILVFNNGELRAYIFLGLFIGISVYILTISKYFVNLNVAILTALKNIIAFIIKIVSYPFKWIYNLLKKVFIIPIYFLKNCAFKIKKKFLNLIKINKKRQNISSN